MQKITLTATVREYETKEVMAQLQSTLEKSAGVYLKDVQIKAEEAK